MLNKLKLQTRLIVIMGSLGGFCFVACLSNIVSARKLGGSLTYLVQHSAPSLRASLEADMAHDSARASLFRSIIGYETGNTNEIEMGASEFGESVKIFKESLKGILAREPAKDVVNAITEVELVLGQYAKAGELCLELIRKSANKTDLRAAQSSFQASFDDLVKKMENMSDKIQADLNSAEASSESVAQKALAIALGMSAVFLVVSVGVILKLNEQITTPLTSAVTALEVASVQVANASRQISDGSQSLAEAASEQAASLEETSASVEEIAAMTKRNAESVENSKRLSRQARDSASSGLEKIADLANTLNTVKGAVGQMESAVLEMQSSSQEIAKIIKTIDEIAFQTNLLALNAAVEAARAGQAGAGFAVVADEVRSLAQRSAQAAKDTSEKIESAVKRSAVGGSASQRVVHSLAEMDATAKNIQNVFSGIVEQIKSLDDIVIEIASASREQSQGLTEVNSAVGQMDKVTQTNAMSAEENASAVEQLNSQVGSLQGVVRRLHSVVNGADALRQSHAQRDVEAGDVTGVVTANRPAPLSSRNPVRAHQKPQMERTSSANVSSPGPEIPMPDPVEAGVGSFKDF